MIVEVKFCSREGGRERETPNENGDEDENRETPNGGVGRKERASC